MYSGVPVKDEVVFAPTEESPNLVCAAQPLEVSFAYLPTRLSGCVVIREFDRESHSTLQQASFDGERWSGDGRGEFDAEHSKLSRFFFVLPCRTTSEIRVDYFYDSELCTKIPQVSLNIFRRDVQTGEVRQLKDGRWLPVRKYEIRVRPVIYSNYSVEATSEEEAKALFLDHKAKYEGRDTSDDHLSVAEENIVSIVERSELPTESDEDELQQVLDNTASPEVISERRAASKTRLESVTTPLDERSSCPKLTE